MTRDQIIKQFDDDISESNMDWRSTKIVDNFRLDRRVNKLVARTAGSALVGIGGAKISELIAKNFLRKKLARIYYLDNLPTRNSVQDRELNDIKKDVDNKILLSQIGGGVTSIALANFIYNKLDNKARKAKRKEAYKTDDVDKEKVKSKPKWWDKYIK